MTKNKQDEEANKEDINNPFFIPDASDKKDQIGKTFQDSSEEHPTLIQRLLKEIELKKLKDTSSK